MENTTRGNGKSKKIIIGIATVVATAAIAVPTALTLSGGKDNAGASHGNKYNIIVSNGIENVPDYSLTIEEGTKIGELKTILKAIDGYKITGVYKDESMQHEYSDNETINSSTKIYIKFEAITYKVNIYNEAGTEIIDTKEVSHKESLSLAEPNKPEDDFASYEFAGWVNERGEAVNLNEITSDLNIRPSYNTTMKEYRIGFIYEAFKGSIKVTIGDEEVDLNTTYHYGSKIKIRATQQEGRKAIEFNVQVGNGETKDLLKEEYRHEENGEVYYEAEFIGNGNLKITYNEVASEYSLGAIPDGVSVKKNDMALASNAIISYGDILEIDFDKDYDVNEFEIIGATHISGNTYSVTGNVEINFEGAYKYAYLTFEYNDSEDGYEVSGFDGSITDVVIPATYNAKRVLGIKSKNYNKGVFYQSSITSLTISEGVKRIGDNAFNSCSSLSSIILPSTITNMGEGAFAGCSSLTSMNYLGTIKNWAEINFGDYGASPVENTKKLVIQGQEVTHLDLTGLTYINSNAFSYCQNITEVIIPESVAKIGKSAFSWCSALESVILSSSITEIPERAFESCDNLATIIIPTSVTKMGTGSFSGCYNLFTVNYLGTASEWAQINFDGQSSNPIECSKKLTIQGQDVTEIVLSGITSINDSAFSGWENLTSVIIEEGVSYIGAWSFNYCSNLESIVLPSTINSIGSYAFSGCNNLTSMNYLGTITNWAEIDFASEYSNPTSCTKRLTIQGRDITEVSLNGIMEIGNYAFYGCQDITTIFAGEGIKYIGSSAFYNCTSLSSITLPSTLVSIGQYAFVSCSSLTSMDYFGTVNDWAQIKFDGSSSTPTSCTKKLTIEGQDVTEIYLSGISLVEDYAFYNCQNITSVNIDKGITRIGQSAFYGCSGMLTTNLPDGLTKIDDSAFRNCSSLSSITLPSSVISFGNSAFYGCNNLKSMNYLGTINDWLLIYFDYRDSNPLYYTKKLTIQGQDIINLNLSGITEINNYAFYNCSTINSVVFGEGLTSIGKYAFSGCSGITSVVFPESLAYINDSAFSNCSNIKEVTIPSGVYEIGSYAFQSCSNLLSVTISEGVTIIGNTAFGSCSKLNSITIPSSVTTIKDNAFESCRGLTEVVIPEGVTTIERLVFRYCTGLTSITLPESLTEMGESIFLGCNAEIYTIYDNAKYLGTANNPYQILVSAKDKNITSCIINENCKIIGSNAFDSCRGLTEIVIPEGVTLISNRAFWICTELQSIEFPSSLKTIGNEAFGGCRKLQSIELLGSISSIGKEAFNNCANLESITISSSVTYFAGGVFRNCYKLKSMNYLGTINDWVQINFHEANSNPVYYTKKLTIQGQDITELDISGITTIKKYVVPTCDTITSIIIGEGVTTIEDWAFTWCYNVRKLIIPASVKVIGSYAFNGFDKLESMDYYGSINDWVQIEFGNEGSNPINYLEKLTIQGQDITEVVLSGIDKISGYAFYNFASLKSIVIPEGVTDIGNCAFYGCSGIDSIEIPSSITNIGYDAFNDCSKLNYKVYGNASYLGNSQNPYLVLVSATSKDITSCKINTNCKIILSRAFEDCNKLISIDIPDGITNIGRYAFSNCDSLKSIVLPSSLRVLGEYAFSHCESLKTVTIYEGLTVIDSGAFLGCSNLESINIPSTVTSIGNNAFSYCKSLTTVTIGKNVSFIGSSAFGNCEKLTSVTFKNTTSWKYGTTSIIINVSYPENNAEYLKSKYYSYNWTRSDI